MDRTWENESAEVKAAVHAMLNSAEPGGARQRDDRTTRPLFTLGKTVTTPAAAELLRAAGGVDAATLFARHERGDWGEVDDRGRMANERALRGDEQLFSVYRIGDERVVWIMTEADRSLSTLLRPADGNA